LSAKKQYLFSSQRGGQGVHVGNFRAYITEACLPVVSMKGPRFMNVDTGVGVIK